MSSTTPAALSSFNCVNSRRTFGCLPFICPSSSQQDFANARLFSSFKHLPNSKNSSCDPRLSMYHMFSKSDIEYPVFFDLPVVVDLPPSAKLPFSRRRRRAVSHSAVFAQRASDTTQVVCGAVTPIHHPAQICDQPLSPVAVLTSGEQQRTGSNQKRAAIARTAQSSDPAESEGVFEKMPLDTIYLLVRYLEPKTLARLMMTCKTSLSVIRNHALWKDVVLRKFGFKYENYAMITQMDTPEHWQQLYSKIANFHSNIAAGRALRKTFPKILEAPPSSFTEPAYLRDYGGSMAVTMDSTIVVWENGTYLQGVDISSSGAAKPLWRVLLPLPTTVNPQRITMSIVITNSKIFTWCPDRFGPQICVFDLFTGAELRRIDAQVSPLGSAGPSDLDYSIRTSQITLLSGESLHVWNGESLDFMFSLCARESNVGHSTTASQLSRRTYDLDLRLTPCGDQSIDANIESTDLPLPALDFIWAGYWCAESRMTRRAADGSSYCSAVSHVDCHRPSKHIVLWFPRASPTIHVHSALDGKAETQIEGHTSDVLRVRQMLHPLDPSYNSYLLVSLAQDTELRMWDSRQGFACVFRLVTGLQSVFRLHVAGDQILVLSPSRQTRRQPLNPVQLTVWRVGFPESVEDSKLSHKAVVGGTSTQSHSTPCSSSQISSAPCDNPSSSEFLQLPVMYDKREHMLGPRTYFAEFIDSSDLLATWQGEVEPPQPTASSKESRLSLPRGESSSSRSSSCSPSPREANSKYPDSREGGLSDPRGRDSPVRKHRCSSEPVSPSSCLESSPARSPSIESLHQENGGSSPLSLREVGVARRDNEERPSFGGRWLSTCEWEVVKMSTPTAQRRETTPSSINQPAALVGPVGSPSLRLKHRSDPWSLLDWKSFEVSPNGSLTVFDFSPDIINLH